MNFLYGFFYATDDEKNMTVSCAFLLLRAFDAVLLLSKAEFARANPVLCFQLSIWPLVGFSQDLSAYQQYFSFITNQYQSGLSVKKQPASRLIMEYRTRILIPFLVDNFKTYLAWPHVHIFGNLASIDMILNFKKRGPFSGKVQHVRPSLCGFPNFTHSIFLLDLRPSSSWLPSREEIKPTCSW